MHVKPFIDFVVARHQVYVNRTAGMAKPWTTDPILRMYRFCNVYRELDTVTKYVRGPWTQASPRAHAPDQWFAMVVARLINWPPSLVDVGAVLPWDPKKFARVLENRQGIGLQVFGPAYIVSTNGRSVPKVKYLTEEVLTPMWEKREHYRPKVEDTLESFFNRLTGAQGMGSFMAAQVVADTKNTFGDVLQHATDWWGWTAPGPGSIRGLNRILGLGGVSKKPGDFRGSVNYLRTLVNPQVLRRGWPALCAQDVQNCLCEYDKYERVRLGEGTPKQRYAGE